MRYFEDIQPGTIDRFGRYEVTREEVVDFARKYDPQPFHLDSDAAKSTLFGGLAAGNGAVVQGYIADVTPPEKRARQMSYQGAAWNVGLIVGQPGDPRTFGATLKLTL